MRKTSKRNSELRNEVPERTRGDRLGDKVSRYCVLDRSGNVMEEGAFAMTERSVEKHFGDLPPARIELEAGARVRWLRDLLAGYSHQAIVGDTRELAPASPGSVLNRVRDFGQARKQPYGQPVQPT